MEITATEMKQCRLVRVFGRVDSSTAPELQEKLAELLQGQPRLVVNLREVPFLSSAGLRVLLSAMQAAKRAGGDLRLSEVSDQVARVLELTAFDIVFKCFASDVEAVASF
ncbi:MAG: STAS domain-containing protein [Nitrososphaerales archaeon]